MKEDVFSREECEEDTKMQHKIRSPNLEIANGLPETTDQKPVDRGHILSNPWAWKAPIKDRRMFDISSRT